MRVRVDVDAAAAAKAGLNQHGLKIVDIDPAELSQAERAELAHHTSDHARAREPAAEFYLHHLNSSMFGYGLLPNTAKADVDAVRGLLAVLIHKRAVYEEKERAAKAEKAARDERERIKAEAEAARRRELEVEFFADPDARASFPYGYNRNFAEWRGSQWDTYNRSSDREFFRVARERHLADIEAKNAQVKAKNAQVKAKQAQAQAERLAFFARWIAEHGDQNDRERFAAGVLAEEELLTLIRRQIFAALAECSRYNKIKVDAVDHDENCRGYDADGAEIDCEITTDPSLSAEEWEALKSLRASVAAALPQAQTTLRRHSCALKCCGGKLDKLGFLVSVTVGTGLEFNREFAI